MLGRRKWGGPIPLSERHAEGRGAMKLASLVLLVKIGKMPKKALTRLGLYDTFNM